jgi:ABC-type phosphate transport system ATPase subunit
LKCDDQYLRASFARKFGDCYLFRHGQDKGIYEHTVFQNAEEAMMHFQKPEIFSSSIYNAIIDVNSNKIMMKGSEFESSMYLEKNLICEEGTASDSESDEEQAED